MLLLDNTSRYQVFLVTVLLEVAVWLVVCCISFLYPSYWLLIFIYLIIKIMSFLFQKLEGNMIFRCFHLKQMQNIIFTTFVQVLGYFFITIQRFS